MLWNIFDESGLTTQNASRQSTSNNSRVSDKKQGSVSHYIDIEGACEDYLDKSFMKYEKHATSRESGSFTSDEKDDIKKIKVMRMENVELFIRSAVVDINTSDELDWQDDALCAQGDPEAFFPEKGESTKEARRTCMLCDVREKCLEYALKEQISSGIWGGHTKRERAIILKEREHQRMREAGIEIKPRKYTRRRPIARAAIA